ncbi:MAG TPA: HDOD domain-containing protein [Accumulibacter sp.]|uniref:HDOD domain-containing protein n=2 Tax=Accumulibacter sp. TaxID=2053492 RepID=UPI002C35D205|nr:HDOD domain-containing protein [Accumulibacter sp.]HNH92297.1 HDOD domain-containing protein [Accumulibacter sp.]HNL97336.1 HDOD domain-containing protein [Accumulibacter sp.]HNN84746.1 HDOD domain-containing protein [Accumulibacter sp.]
MGLAELTLSDASLITATFLFTDIEGSTSLWERESAAMRVALQRHNALLGAAIDEHGGDVFKTVGDAFCVAFTDAGAALHAACRSQMLLAAEKWPTRAALRVRIALHTGTAYVCAGDYFGTTVNRCARLLAVTRGGQTLLTSTTEALIRTSLPSATRLHDAGMLRLRDLPHPVHVFQLVHPGLAANLLEVGDVTPARKPEARAEARFRPSDLYEVPTLPAIVLQAMKALQDPRCNAKTIERVVARDPAISAKILRVANSAFFGYSRRIGTIAEAIQLLGFANVQGMIISVGAFDAFRAERLRLLDLWRHSITTATAARFLAPLVRCSPDEAFMAGLLHDIGKLILAVQAEPGYQRVLDLRLASPVTNLAAERALFDFTHPEVGEMVAERWDLPPRYVAAIAHHHQPAAAGGETVFCALIGLADRAAYTTLPDADREAGGDDEVAELLAMLGLATEHWDGCRSHLLAGQAEIEALLGAIQ